MLINIRSAIMADFIAENIAFIEKLNICAYIASGIFGALAALLYLLLDEDEKDSYTFIRMLWGFAETAVTMSLPFITRFISTKSGMLEFAYWFIIVLIPIFFFNVCINVFGIKDYYLEKDYKWTTTMSVIGDTAFMIYAVAQVFILINGCV